ncbi:MAG: hypothetical protein JEZ06_03615 [Anaerolineaceae bacterium]|nr:hypothetical protein [Anaerolineaceae bacterium]
MIKKRQYIEEEVMCFVCDFWWLALIIITLLLASLLAMRSLFDESNPNSILPGASSEEQIIGRELLDEIMRPGEDLDELALSRQLELDQLIDPVPVAIEGTIKSLSIFDWSNGSAAYLSVNGIAIAYPGYVSHFKLGDRVRIAGIYLPSKRGIQAHQVKRLQNKFEIANKFTLPDIAYWLAGIWLLISLGVFFIGLINHNRKRKGLFLKLVLSFLFLFIPVVSGCTMNFNVIVNQDGSGYNQIIFQEKKETIDFLHQVPGLSGYINRWVAEQRVRGVLVDNLVVEEAEFVTLQKNIKDHLAFNTNSSDQEQINWVSLLMYADGQEMVYRYLARIDSSNLGKLSDEFDSNIQKEATKLIREMDLIYTLILPGEIVYHNGDLDGLQVMWQLLPQEKEWVIAESRLPVEEKFLSGVDKVSAATSWWFWSFFMFFTSLLLFGGIFLLRMGGFDE